MSFECWCAVISCKYAFKKHYPSIWWHPYFIWCQVEEPHEGEMTVMTAAMVAKYCAMEEMNGRINPAMSDSDEDSNGKNAGNTKPPGAPLVGQVVERPGAVPASVQKEAKGGGLPSPAKVIPAILRAGSITEGPALRSGSISGPPPGARRLFNESDDDGGSRGGGARSGGKSYQTAL